MTGMSGARVIRRVIGCTALAAVGAGAGALCAADWPQWRGPRGEGTSSETGLPVEWTVDSPAVCRRTPLPGAGDSSPCVSNGRVFVTTVFKGPLRTAWTNASAAVAAVAAAAVCVLHAMGRKRRRRCRARIAGDVQVALVWGTIAFTAVITLMREQTGLPARLAADSTPLLLCLAVIAALGLLRARSTVAAVGCTVLLVGGSAAAWLGPSIPEPLPLTVLFGLAAVLTARARPPGVAGPTVRLPDRTAPVDDALVTFATLTFLTTAVTAMLRPEYFWIADRPGPRWVMSGLIATLGLTAAVGRFPADSAARAVGAVVLLAATGLLYYLVPEDVHPHIGPVNLRDAALVIGLLSALWFDGLFVYRRLRASAGPRTDRRTAVSALLTAGIAALVFVPTNYGPPAAALEHAVVCVELRSGRVLWIRTVFATPVHEVAHPYAVHAHPTPAADGKVVVAHFSAGTACLDFEGRVLWKRPDPQTEPPLYGAAASPIIVGESVIVVVEADTLNCGAVRSNRTSSIVSLDRLSGRVRWQLEPEEHSDSYATPLAVRRGGLTELITVTRGAVIGYDVHTGDKLWSVSTPLRQIVAGPVIAGDMLFLGGGTFGPKAVLAFRLIGSGRQTEAQLIWQSPRGVPGCASPVVLNGRLYTLTDRGILTVFGGNTGAVLATTHLPGVFYASLVAADGRLYACNEEGCVTALDIAGRVIGRSRLDEPMHASPAVADGCLVLRGRSALYCIDGRARRVNSPGL